MTENEVKKEARNLMELDGFIFWFPFPRWLPSIQKWQRADIFEVFDCIALKGKKVYFIQFTTLQHLSDRRKKIQAFYKAERLEEFPNGYVWAWDKKKGLFKIEHIK